MRLQGMCPATSGYRPANEKEKATLLAGQLQRSCAVSEGLMAGWAIAFKVVSALQGLPRQLQG
jgi:hypothetical protein